MLVERSRRFRPGEARKIRGSTLEEEGHAIAQYQNKRIGKGDESEPVYLQHLNGEKVRTLNFPVFNKTERVRVPYSTRCAGGQGRKKGDLSSGEKRREGGLGGRINKAIET